MTRLNRLFTAILMILISAGAASAQQGLFAPKVIVNDRVVSNYEFGQRLLFMQLLTGGAATEEEALNALISDRLRTDAAATSGIQADPETVRGGMVNFASRANMTPEQLIAALAQAGVAAQTFRDFVEAGVLWNQVVRARFGPRAQVSEAEIDRAMAGATRPSGLSVLLSEIILRADSPEAEARARRLADQLSREITSESSFASAARRHSVANTKGRGGKLNWSPASQLPPALRGAVLGLKPGEMTNPVKVPGAIGLFFLHELRDGSSAEFDPQAIEYVRYYLERGTADEAAKVSAAVDTCDDFYGVAKGEPEERLLREVKPLPQIPQEVALALAPLDENETVFFGKTGSPSVLMLCARTPQLDDNGDRAQVREQLINQRLVAYSNGYLAELRADAIIRYP